MISNFHSDLFKSRFGFITRKPLFCNFISINHWIFIPIGQASLSIMSLSLLLMAALVAGTSEVRESVRAALRFEPYDNVIQMDSYQGKPPFCKKLDCPLYTVVNKTDKYELRQYNPILWAQSNTKGIDYQPAIRKNFRKLFNYIQGANEKNQTIPMTVPVLNKIIPGQGPACESDFTMSFFLTQKRTDFRKFPKATNGVTLFISPRFRVYVRSFSGYYMRYSSWRDQALKLGSDIGNPRKFDASSWYTVGYDSPFTLFNRHNEVWFVAK